MLLVFWDCDCTFSFSVQGSLVGFTELGLWCGRLVWVRFGCGLGGMGTDFGGLLELGFGVLMEG